MRTITKPTTVYKVPVQALLEGRSSLAPILPVEIHCPQDCKPRAVYETAPDEEYPDLDTLLEDHQIAAPLGARTLMWDWERYQSTAEIEVEP